MIIDNPHLQTKSKRTIWLWVTFFMWTVYAYLWWPLVSLVAWWLGYKSFIFHMVTHDGASHLKILLISYFSFLAILCGALLVWAQLEKFRFKDKSRRSNSEPIKNQLVADHYSLNEAEIAAMQKQKIVTVEFNEAGNITQFHT